MIAGNGGNADLEMNGLLGIDLWARDHALVVEDRGLVPTIGSRFANNGALRVYADFAMDFPEEFLRVAEPRFADVIITNRKDAYGGPAACAADGDDCSMETCRVKGQLYLRPRNLVIGIEYAGNASPEEIEDAVRNALDDNNLSFLSICCLSTISLKESVPGLREFAQKLGVLLQVFRSDQPGVEGIERRDPVYTATGAHNAAETAARLAAETDGLLVSRQKQGQVTVAVAVRTIQGPECGARSGKGSS